MTQQFTANEVRELAKHMESVGWRPDSNGDPDCYDEGAARSAEMLFTFADLLEAQEKAMPVAWMHFYRKKGGGTRMWFPTLVLEAEPQDGYEWIETRPLSEGTTAVLAAHSAQAQPQNGDWVLVPRNPTHAMRESAASYGGRGGYNKQRGDDAMEVWRDMLAAVPQPPAARVPDWTDAQCVAFMAVGLRHTEYKKGKSPTVEEIRQGAKAALAAQENPNG